MFLYYLDSEDYTVFPNPALKNQPLFIVSNDPGISYLQVFNSIGTKVWEQKVNSQIDVVITDRLPGGTYFFRLLRDGKQKKTLKVILY